VSAYATWWREALTLQDVERAHGRLAARLLVTLARAHGVSLDAELARWGL